MTSKTPTAGHRLVTMRAHYAACSCGVTYEADGSVAQRAAHKAHKAHKANPVPVKPVRRPRAKATLVAAKATAPRARKATAK